MSLLLLAMLAPGALAAAAGAVVQTPEVRAELLAHAPEGVAPGKPLWLGLSIEHQPHWHTYWKNPGDSGLPTSLQWQLPADFSAGAIDWPRPQKLPAGPLINYGYEGRLLLPVPVQVQAVPAGARGVDVKLHAEWLVCKETCIPQSGDFAITVPAGSAAAPITRHAARFEAALARRPVAFPDLRTEARVDGAVLALSIDGLPAAWRGGPVDYFAADAGVIDHAARAEQRWDGERLQLRVPLSPQRSASPARLAAVLAPPREPAGVRIDYLLAGGWPAAAGGGPAAAPAPAPPASSPAPPPESMAELAVTTPPGAIAGAWLMAFVGGMLLNLMPCVFPVLTLKVLGFAKHAQQRRLLVAGGIAYAGGVVASFVALAALLLMLRAAGAGLGWGFQLQSPPFVAGLAALFTLIGLNLAGLFEFGKFAPDSACTLRARRPLVDHALTGALAVLIASPCTAPFMGVALGYALTKPAPLALMSFVMLGLGMATPYLVATCWPRVALWLPRPGPWMARFRTLMSFPMFATVVWLVWVLGQQVGIDGAAALLAALLVLTFTAWVHAATGGTPRRWLWRGASAVLFVAALGWMLPLLTQHPAPHEADQAAALPSGARWQPWSPERVQQALAEGRPVFVDFTAAWCVTCQFNKRGVLANRELLSDFERGRVLLLRADWTRRDERITRALSDLKRSGVPVYALYTPGQAVPRLFPEILSVALLREAVAVWVVAGRNAP